MCVRVGKNTSPQAVRPTTKHLHAPHRRGGDEGGDKPIFNRSGRALVNAKHAQALSDSDHATLLWSRSTMAGVIEARLTSPTCGTVNSPSAVRRRPGGEMEKLEGLDRPLAFSRLHKRSGGRGGLAAGERAGAVEQDIRRGHRPEVCDELPE